MGDRLQQTLRSLCCKTQWKYAVFWKLKHRARKMLTWEDAYYDKDEPSDPSKNQVTNICSCNALENLLGGHYMGDPLELAVAKMSYLVYSLGEGIIGQVASTGRHRWMFADEPASVSRSSTEYRDGWKTQFAAGVKTVAVLAVVPHGVVQLGSLNMVVEDLKLVSHIKDVFGLPQSSSSALLPDSKVADLCPQVRNSLNLPVFPTNCVHGADQAVSNKRPILHPHFPSPGKCSDFCNDVRTLCDHHESDIVQVVPKSLMPIAKSVELVKQRPGKLASEFQKQMELNLFNSNITGVHNPNDLIEMCLAAKCIVGPSCDVCVQNMNLNSGAELFDAYKVDHYCLPLTFDPVDQEGVKSAGALYHEVEEQQLPECIGMQQRNDFEGKSMSQTSASGLNTINPPLKFSARCELHEMLGSSFRKGQDTRVWYEEGLAESEGLVEAPDRVLSGLLNESEGSEHLLEAVVAHAYPGTSITIHENSLCKSSNSLLTTEPMLHSLKHVKHDNSGSGQVLLSTFMAEEDMCQHRSSAGASSEPYAVRSLNDALSGTQDRCSELSDRNIGLSKISRKRARCAENCRPRPRDRQLIQDRIKELRDIVPNGSKCSIDTLLERTAKHMLFLQSVTSHADKLKRCTESKLCENVSHLLGNSSHEHHASWALEVGVNSNSCPIIVENLDVNGQMVVEMLCKECSLFFKIAEVIKGLGFTILKGVTEARAGKTWACFVVEGQGNRSTQRMNILWSLMQLLEPEICV